MMAVRERGHEFIAGMIIDGAKALMRRFDLVMHAGMASGDVVMVLMFQANAPAP